MSIYHLRSLKNNVMQVFKVTEQHRSWLTTKSLYSASISRENINRMHESLRGTSLEDQDGEIRRR